MTLRHTFYIAVLLSVTISASAQISDNEQQYKAAMQNAKSAFDAKMYSEALYFYREALKIKPDAKLPRYKIEDIRTIYIDDGIREIAENKQITQEEAQQQAETKADERIETEIEQTQKELETLKIATILDINDGDSNIDEIIDIEDVEPTQRPKIEIKEMPNNIEPIIEKPKSETPKIEKQNTEKQAITSQKEIRGNDTKPIAPPKAKPTTKPTQPAKTISDEEKEARKEAEKQKLRIQYPEQKTVLEIDQPGKHITRVIMNINNEISIYLKVRHSWGATFYFKDEIGEDNLISISELTFNQMTNLANYGH